MPIIYLRSARPDQPLPICHVSRNQDEHAQMQAETGLDRQSQYGRVDSGCPFVLGTGLIRPVHGDRPNHPWPLRAASSTKETLGPGWLSVPAVAVFEVDRRGHIESVST
jgi:hypothetical protein